MIELLIVVVVLGVLAVAGLPRVGLISRKEKTSRAAQVVRTDIERAFGIAARLRKPVLLVFNNSAKSYQVIDESGGAVRFTRRLDDAGDMGVQSLAAFPASITIRPNGVASDTLNVLFTTTGTTRELSMTRVGLIRRVQ